MKKTIFTIIVLLIALFTFTPAYSQANLEYRMSDVLVSINYPETWEVSREHVLLLLIPQNKDFVIQLEVMGEDLDKIVKESMNNIITEFPLDTNIIKKEYKINGMKVVELSLQTSENTIINYLHIVTLKKKVLKFHLNSPEKQC